MSREEIPLPIPEGLFEAEDEAREALLREASTPDLRRWLDVIEEQNDHVPPRWLDRRAAVEVSEELAERAQSAGHTAEAHLDDDPIDLSPMFDTPPINTTDDGRHFDEAGREYHAVTTDTGELDFTPVDDVPVPRCPLPAVGAWRWYPTAAGRPSTLPGVAFCRLHEATARELAEAQTPERHYLHHDTYRQDNDTVRCQVHGLPNADRDADRIGTILDQARSAILRLTSLTANVRGVSALVGNEDAVLDALVGLAADVAAEVDVVGSRVEARRRRG